MASEEGLSLADVVQSPSAPNSLTPPVLPSDAVTVPAVEMVDDRIITAVRQEESEDVVLHAVIYGLAEEQNSLQRLREKKDREGKDTSHISLKRGQLLKYMSETLLQKRAIAGASEEIDLRGPKFREIFKMFLETISDSFDEVKIPVEYKEMFFTSLARNLEGWEERAEKIARSVDNRQQVNT
jgi:predicted RNA-binding protein